MRLFSYVIRWDHGFAPNPFYATCSLATCKPKIRSVAEIGDYVLGTGSASRGLGGHAVFLMRVDEILTFDQYWDDPRFARKIPVMNGSLQQRFGDNIYHRKDGKWVQADSRHSQVGAKPNFDNLKRDTGTTERILLGGEFTYWGGTGPEIPEKFSDFVHTRPAHRSSFTPPEILRFLRWISKYHPRGLVDEPFEWKYAHRWR